VFIFVLLEQNHCVLMTNNTVYVNNVLNKNKDNGYRALLYFIYSMAIFKFKFLFTYLSFLHLCLRNMHSSNQHLYAVDTCLSRQTLINDEEQ